MAQSAPFTGQLNRPVTIYKKILEADELGHRAESLQQVCAPWAHMKDVSGTQEAEGAIMSVVNRSYTIRRRAEVVTGGRNMVVQDGTQRFEVTGLKEIERSHIELLVTAIENNGAYADAPIITP